MFCLVSALLLPMGTPSHTVHSVKPVEEHGVLTINPDGSETETESFSLGPEVTIDGEALPDCGLPRT